MKKLVCLLGMLALVMVTNTASSQGLLKKMKEKANQTLDKAVGKEVEKKTGIPAEQEQSNNNTSSGNSSGKPVNKGGSGLSNTEPPDVKMQMTEAETAHGAKKYSDARYSLQQALMGVEIQLGRQILKSLPGTVVRAAGHKQGIRNGKGYTISLHKDHDIKGYCELPHHRC